MALSELKRFDSQAQAKQNFRFAIETWQRAWAMPRRSAVSYVHPEVLTSYLDGNLVLEIKSVVETELREELDELKPGEAAVLARVRGKLAREESNRDVVAKAA